MNHFKEMAQALQELSQLPGEVLEHHYSGAVFGSWWSVVRHRGIVVRVTFDGKESTLVAERSATRKPPYEWGAPIVQLDVGSGEACRALVSTVVRATSAG